MASLQRIDDLLISLAYFTIPIQVSAIWVKHYAKLEKLSSLTWKIYMAAILFVLFFLLGGLSHTLRFLDLEYSVAFQIINGTAAFISIAAAGCLIPAFEYLYQNYNLHVEKEHEAKQKLLEFMNFLCHEIRNPLFAITSTLPFIDPAANFSSRKVESAVTCIQQSSNLMIRLVNDVLDISKLESGDLELESHPFNLHALLQGAVRSIESQLQDTPSTAELRFSVPTTFPSIVQSDSVRILQIAYNLLSNAAKFTNQGYIHVSVDTIPVDIALKEGFISKETRRTKGEFSSFLSKRTMQSYSSSKAFSIASHDSKKSLGTVGAKSRSSIMLEKVEENDEQEDIEAQTNNNNNGGCESLEEPSSTWMVFKLQVQDTGVGMSPELVKSIQTPYSNDKLSQYRAQGGTGLGLTILDRLTALMGGRMCVESEIGIGSTFTVYVPILVLPDEIFAAEENQELLHDTFRAEMHAQEEMSQSLRMSAIMTNAMLSLDRADSVRGSGIIINSNTSPASPPPPPPSRPAPLWSTTTISSLPLPPPPPPPPLPGSEDANDNVSVASTTESSSSATMNSPSVENLVKTVSVALAEGQHPPASSTTLPQKEESNECSSPQVVCVTSSSTTTTTKSDGSTTTKPTSSSGSGGGSSSSISTSSSPAISPPVSSPVRKKSIIKNPNATKNTAAAAPTFDFPPGEKVVLVVDDNAMNRKFFGRMLSQLKIEQAYATQGKEAVDFMRESRNCNPNDSNAPQVGMILMDWSMPIMDGCEAIRYIRNNLGLKKVPIVAVTACALEAPKEELLGAGADEFATKPLMRADLIQKCQRYLLQDGDNANRHHHHHHQQQQQHPRDKSSSASSSQ